jgi:hypothetical protein
VQSSTTKQVSVANLTAGRAVSALSLTSTTTLGVTGTSTLSGNAIISVTDNTNAALRITQLGTGNALLVEDTTNPDASPFVIDASGSVIVGNTSQYAIVSTTPKNIQSSATSGVSGFTATLWASSSAGSASSVNLLKSRGAAQGAYLAVVANDTLGALNFAGDDGTNFVSAASIFSQVDGTPGTNDMPGRLVFSTTADGASSPTERMRIGSSGNVGIGGTAATVSLYINKNITGGAFSYASLASGTVQSDVTSVSAGFVTTINTAATAFTSTSLRHFFANQGTIGAGSTVTNQVGFYAESNLTGATNNYGFYGNIASGTNRYNLYMAGTAANYLAGALSVAGDTTLAAYTETIVASGTVGASATLAITAGTVLTATLTASTPCTFTMPTGVAGKSFILRLTQAATGMTTATFTGVKWPGGTAPTITATASAVDIISFVYIGTDWYGNAAQAFA